MFCFIRQTTNRIHHEVAASKVAAFKAGKQLKETIALGGTLLLLSL
ncbi:hypothetical protein [Candidatus Thiodubiliella endoseptemdiera]